MQAACAFYCLSTSWCGCTTFCSITSKYTFGLFPIWGYYEWTFMKVHKQGSQWSSKWTMFMKVSWVLEKNVHCAAGWRCLCRSDRDDGWCLTCLLALCLLVLLLTAGGLSHHLLLLSVCRSVVVWLSTYSASRCTYFSEVLTHLSLWVSLFLISIIVFLKSTLILMYPLHLFYAYC